MVIHASLQRTLLALGLSLFFIPLSHMISPRAIIDGYQLDLVWLPLSVTVALMLLFGRNAVVPIIAASLLLNYTEWRLSFIQNAALVMCQTLPLFLFCALLRFVLGKRWRFGVPNRWTGIRIFWLSFATPCLLKLMMFLVGAYLTFPDTIAPYFSTASVIFRIIDLLSLIAASLIFTQFFYYLLRMILSPHYAETFWRVSLMPYVAPEKRAFLISWMVLIVLLLVFLCRPSESALIGGYLVPVIFVVFTIGIRRLDPKFLMLFWSFAVWLLLTYNDNFLHGLNSHYPLAFVLAVFISFTICILYMTTIFQKSEWVKRRLHKQALSDPLTQLPNLRALEQQLQIKTLNSLCCLRMNNLEFLSRHYGMLMRIHCKRTISQTLQPWLHDGERVFQLPGNELLIILNGPALEARITHMLDQLNSRKINWHNNWIELEFSAAWGVMGEDDTELQTMLGQLSYLAEQASTVNRVLSLNASQAVVTGQTSEQVLLLQKVKQALDEGWITLYAQPIVDASDRGYHEILTRLFCKDEMLTPDKFIPVVRQFNLSVRFDLLVIEKMLAWIQANPADDALRFSVNLMPPTLMRRETARQIISLFRQYGVATSCVILEITEEQAFSGSEISTVNIEMLRASGFRIAIDDFGTGYSNYERLKHVQADIIKIDGSFIKDIVTDSMDAMIVKSICEMAKVKSLSVVAEYVETAAQRELLLALGVNYLQGYLTGKPQPLSDLKI